MHTFRNSTNSRTVQIRRRLFHIAKSDLKLVAPTEVNRTVAPTRRPNADFRTGEHLTRSEDGCEIEGRPPVAGGQGGCDNLGPHALWGRADPRYRKPREPLMTRENDGLASTQ